MLLGPILDSVYVFITSGARRPRHFKFPLLTVLVKSREGGRGREREGEGGRGREGGREGELEKSV